VTHSLESETRVAAELVRYGLRSQSFTKEERRGRKTPDRRVYRGLSSHSSWKSRRLRQTPGWEALTRTLFSTDLPTTFTPQ